MSQHIPERLLARIHGGFKLTSDEKRLVSQAIQRCTRRLRMQRVDQHEPVETPVVAVREMVAAARGGGR